jgi:hypothetical protein
LACFAFVVFVCFSSIVSLGRASYSIFFVPRLPSFHHVHHTRYPVMDAIRSLYIFDLLKTVSFFTHPAKELG